MLRLRRVRGCWREDDVRAQARRSWKIYISIRRWWLDGVDTDVQGHKCAQMLFSEKVPSFPRPPPKNSKNVLLLQQLKEPRFRICRPPQHPLLKARKHFVFMIFHHPPLRRRVYLFFAWLEGFFPSLLFARSPAHCQRVNGTNPGQIIREEPARPSFSGGRLCTEAIWIPSLRSVCGAQHIFRESEERWKTVGCARGGKVKTRAYR